MWSTGKWHDYNCNVVAFFICEAPIRTKNDIIKEKKLQHHSSDDIFSSGDYDYDDEEL